MTVTLTVRFKESTSPSGIPGISHSIRQLDSVAEATVDWGDEPDDEEDDWDDDDWYSVDDDY